MNLSSSFINYLLLFGAGLIWGSQYILNKLALESFSTWMIAAARIGIGVITLTLLLLGGAEKKLPDLPSRRGSFWHTLPDFIMIGFLEATIPCLLVAWAQLKLASSVTAILIGTVPLFATLLEAFFIKGSQVSLKKGAGIFLGFLGIVVLVAPNFYASSFPLLPILAVLTSAFCFALAMLLIQLRLQCRFGPIASAQGILIGGAITTFPLACWMTRTSSLMSLHPTLSATVALIALGIFCGGIVYTLFVLLIRRAGPSFASMTNYLVPPMGAFIGIVFSGEPFTKALLGSLLLVLAALWLSRTSKFFS